jgi:serpin B
MKKAFLSIMFISVAFISCQKEDLSAEEIESEAELLPLTEEVEKQIVQENNTFAFDLLRTVVKGEEEGTNIFLSPLSATLALGMLNNGAAGQTQEEIQKSLGYGDITRAELNSYFQKTIAQMKESDSKVVFETANSIWIRQNVPVLAPFTNVNKTFYDADVRNEDFNDPATVGLINGWCAEKTHNTIKEIVKDIPSDMCLFLINALYFKSVWTVPFDKQETKDEAFTNLDGTTSLVPTMYKESTFHYAHNESFEILELPYGNQSFAMVILLPKEGTPLSSVIEKLDVATWTNIRRYLIGGETVKVKLPRFKVEYERTLNPDLADLGMKAMFTPAADFSLINTTASLFVSSVRQKTFVEVNEEGTEASAVTVIETDAANDLLSEKPTFYVNRPFLYLIQEKQTGAIFFTGIINNL